MLFNSISFLIFFLIVTTTYFILPHRYRWLLLLIASCYFYMNFIPVYILVLLVLIIIDYFAGRFIEHSKGKRKTLYLILSIFSTCLVLFIFKYFNFFNANLSALADFINWNYSLEYLSLALPIGLSFHTFQSLSYVIEVYKGNQKAEKHFGIYALYVMFYPQLVAGPIERPSHLLHQFYEKHRVDWNRIIHGLQIMLWGFFLKLVIADRAAIFVNAVYNNVYFYSGMPLIIATYSFAFQIFCDFAGYSLIALGCAKVMGFQLMVNFKRPYLSKSIPEFWRRWHISLSSWFRDYIYIPLGGNRVSTGRLYLNIFLVFLISGLWHGAAWTFVIWGALHGFYMVISQSTELYRKKLSSFFCISRFPKLHNILKILITFNLVAFGWIFFRANSLADANYIITHLFSNLNLDFLRASVIFDRSNLFLLIVFIVFMEIVHFIQEKKGIRSIFYKLPEYLRLLAYFLLLLVILLFGVFTNTKFIYFQF